MGLWASMDSLATFATALGYRTAYVAKQFSILGASFLNKNWKLLGLIFVLVVSFTIIKRYRKWRREWLSGQIDSRIREIRRSKTNESPSHKPSFSSRAFYYGTRSRLFRSIQATEDYFINFRYRAIDLYLPSLASSAIILTIFIALFVGPHISELWNWPAPGLVDTRLS
jgi:ABC-type transport system involved in cytochrome bd biosynthesis fused ATPase/permease subunit